MLFLIGGREFDVFKEDLERQAMNLEPVQFPQKGFFVEINGEYFELKQLIAALVCLPKKAFITLDAYTVLKELGYAVIYNRRISGKMVCLDSEGENK